jgi:hypothetical protein
VKAFAILLDTRPGYLDRAHGAASLLLAPLGPTTVLRYLGERLAAAGHPRLTIATDFEPGPDYERRVKDSGARWMRSWPPATSPAGSTTTSPRTGS